MAKSKPRGHWQKWSNVEAELSRAISQIGHFPSHNELTGLGLSSVARAVCIYHGGYGRARERMGYSRNAKPKGYWDSWENTQKELELIVEQLGHFPTQKELRELGLSALDAGIGIHGGFREVRSRLGYDQTRKGKDYWKNWDNVETELKTIIDDNDGAFPTHQVLVSSGNSNLSSAIVTYHGGFNKARQRMGYEEDRKSRGYWTEWQHVEERLLEVTHSLGRFPTQGDLEEIGETSLSSAISKYHGGIVAARKRLGYGEDQHLEDVLESYTGSEND